jgi:hypothetical protein
MGRSIAPPAKEAVSNQEFRHARSKTELRVRWEPGKLIHEMSRGGRRAAYETAWAIGSGHQGKSYVVSVGDALFQSPVSWYTERQKWDVSPGFEDEEHPDFFRPVTSDCLFCHAGRAVPRAGTLNRYVMPPFFQASIGCDRCHGDAASHVAAPRRDNIVNPSRLAGARRDAVCEQCHLSGEARIPNPGRAFSDYRPGMLLEEVFSVYVKESADKGLKVVSHSEQMSRSQCYLASSGRLWCATCHDPHQESAQKASWYRGKCLGCHMGEAVKRHEDKAGIDCAGCHMPKLKAYDGGHTAFHDHWIRRHPDPAPAQETGDGLRAWREPPESLRGRNLGLAYISAGSKNLAEKQLLEGFRLLQSVPADGAVETARGLVLLRTNKAGEAVKAFDAAVEEQPQDSTRRLNLAAALWASGERDGAKRNAEKAIELEPLLEDAYALLAEIEPQRAAYWRGRYTKLAPQRMLP